MICVIVSFKILKFLVFFGVMYVSLLEVFFNDWRFLSKVFKIFMFLKFFLK